MHGTRVGLGYSPRLEATIRTCTQCLPIWVPGSPGPGSSGPQSPGPLNIVSPHWPHTCKPGGACETSSYRTRAKTVFPDQPLSSHPTPAFRHLQYKNSTASDGNQGGTWECVCCMTVVALSLQSCRPVFHSPIKRSKLSLATSKGD